VKDLGPNKDITATDKKIVPILTPKMHRGAKIKAD
jgi:hypothetical protein